MTKVHHTPDAFPPRRWVALGLGLLIPLMGLVALFVYEQQTPPRWRQLLDAYQEEASAAGENWTVRAVHTAQVPEGLVETLPLRPVTENPHFRLRAPDRDELVGSDSRGPLPYPPSQAECVFLVGSDGEEQVVVIAHHSDFDSGAWILHEADATGLALDETLTRIGCPAP